MLIICELRFGDGWLEFYVVGVWGRCSIVGGWWVVTQHFVLMCVWQYDFSEPGSYWQYCVLDVQGQAGEHLGAYCLPHSHRCPW